MLRRVQALPAQDAGPASGIRATHKAKGALRVPPGSGCHCQRGDVWGLGCWVASLVAVLQLLLVVRGSVYRGSSEEGKRDRGGVWVCVWSLSARRGEVEVGKVVVVVELVSKGTTPTTKTTTEQQS